MNGPFVVAQASTAEATAPKKPIRIVKVTKPLDGQAITIELGYEQQTKLDLSGVANEKMTFVHIGEKLIILFDNSATVTVEPFFDSMGVPRQDLTVEVAPGRELPSGEFASLFPITTDQSVLAGAANAAQNPPSGANFSDPSVEPLLTPTPLPLLGPEELPNWIVEFETIPLQEVEPPVVEEEEEPPPPNGLPSIAANAQVVQLDDDALGGIPGGTGDDPDSINANGSLAHDFGPDGAGTVLLLGTGNLPVMPPGLEFSFNPISGTQLQILQNGIPVLTITVTDPTTGAYLVQQGAPIVHPPGFDENNLPSPITINYRVTDSNGDFVDGVLSINVDDDSPNAVVIDTTSAAIVLDESAVAPGGDGIVSATADFSGNFAAVTAFGADGAGSVTYSLVLTGSNVASGLFALDPADASVVDGDGIGQGAQIVLNQSGNVITGSIGAITYFTIQINPATGVVTFTRVANIWHGDTSNHDDPETLTLSDPTLLRLVQTVTDADGDTASAALNLGAGVFQIEDDGPDAVVVINTPDTLVLDESPAGQDEGGDFAPAGLNTVSANFADNFGLLPNFGTDGPSSATYSLVLTGSNVASGLFALGVNGAQGAPIVLNKVGNDILGQVGAVTYFTISVDGNGVVTFTQSLNVWHADTTSDDDTATLTLSDPALLQLTVTDADGDTASAAINLGGGVFQIEDDGPTAAIVATGAGVVMDESIGERPADSIGTADPNDTADDNVAANPFLPAYGTPIGLLSNVDLVNTTTTTGEDNEGATTVVTLAIAGGVNGTDSGLQTTDNRQISLFNESGVIVGRMDTAGGVADPAGTVAFAISINNAGEVTVAQYLSLEHPTPGASYDEAVNLGSLVEAVVTVTDGDGDVATDTVAIGAAISFEDDGPTASIDLTQALVTLDESVGERPADSNGTLDPNDTADDISVGNPDPFGGLYGTPIGAVANVALVAPNAAGVGADDEGATTTTAVTLQIVNGQGSDSGLDTSDGTQVDLFLEANGDVTGRIGGVNGTVIFAIRIDGSGNATVAQYDSLRHGDAPDNYDEAVTLAGNLNAIITVTDGDNDVAVDTVAIGAAISFEDDGPIQVAGTVAETVYEDLLTGGNPDTPANPAGAATVATGTLATLVSFGADQPGTITLSTITAGLPQNLTSIGAPVVYNVTGNLLTAFVDTGPAGLDAGDRQVFTLQITPATGAYTFTLLDQLDHGLGANDNDEALINIDLSSVIVATDADSDVVPLTGGFIISVENDIPVQTAGTVAETVYEDLLTGGNPDTPANPAGAATVATGTLATLVSFGADQPGTITLSPNTAGLPQNLTSIGAPVVYNVTGNLLTAFVDTGPAGLDAGDRQVFTLQITPATGAYTFTLLDQLDHGLGVNDDDEALIAINLSSILVATDADGDFLPLTGGFTISVENDIPLPLVGTVAQTVYEDLLTGGNPDTPANPAGAATVATGTLATLVSFGADQPGTITLSPNTAGLPQNLTSIGAPVVYNVTGNLLTAFVDTGPAGLDAGDRQVFTLQITPATGAYTFTLLDQLDHGLGVNDDDEALIAINFTSILVATDADGDFVPLTGGFTISVENDIPLPLVGTVAQTVYEDLLTGGNPDTPANPAGAATVATGTLATLVSFGADQPGTITLSPNTAGLPQNLTSIGAPVVYNVTGNLLTAFVDTGPAGLDAGDRQVFTLQITPATGAYTFTLLDQLDHGLGVNDDDEALIAINFTSILVATDADGDFVPLTGGFTISVENDIPLPLVGTVAQTVYEDLLTGGNPDTPANPAGAATVATGTLATLVSFGADQPGTITLSPNTAGLPQNLTSIGAPVVYNVTGNLLTAYVESNATPGLQAGDRQVFTLQITDPATGAYTFTLLDQLDHGLGANDDDEALINIDLSSVIVATDADSDVVPLTGGFTISVENDIPLPLVGTVAQTVYEDLLTGGNPDTPANPAGAATVATGTLATLVSFGADQPGTITLSPNTAGLPQNLTSIGAPVVYNVTGNLLTAFVDTGPAGLDAGDRQVFTLQITPATGAYTFTLLDQLDHGLGVNDDDEALIAINFTSILVATDADGDFVPLTGGFTISVENDIPLPLVGTVAQTVYEDLLTGGNPDTPANPAGAATVATGTLATLVSFGADQPGTITLSPNTAGLPQNLTSIGAPVVYNVTGNLLTAFVDTGPAGLDAGDRQVFTLQITPATGAYTFTLLDQLDHGLGVNDDDEALIAINFTSILVATDADGDFVPLTGGFTISVENDIPLPLVGTVAQTVYEDLLTGGNPDTPANPAGAATVATGTLATLVSFGADQPGTITLSPNTAGLPQNLTSIGAPVVYNVTGNLLTAFVDTGPAGLDAGDRQVFTLQITPATGAYTFTLLDQLDHGLGVNDDDEALIAINFTSILVATDADGDFVPLTGGFTISVENDIPLPLVGTVAQTVYEDLLTGGNPDTPANPAGAATVATGTLATLVSFGADQPGTITLSPNTAGLPQNLTSIGAPVVYNVTGNLLTAFVDTGPAGLDAGDRQVFTLQITPATGAYTFTLLDQLDHGLGVNDDDEALIAINFTSILVATDADGDFVPLTGGFIISVENDIPLPLVGTVAQTVYEDLLTGGNPDTPANPAGAATVATGTLATLVSFGADQPGTITLSPNTAGLPQNLTSIGAPVVYNVTGNLLTAFVDTGPAGLDAGDRQVFTLQITPATGAYTFTLLDQLDHGLGVNDDDEALIAINFTSILVATDADGDFLPLTGGFTISVENDIPLAIAPDHAVVTNSGAGLVLPFELDQDGMLADNYGGDDLGGTVRFAASLENSPSGLTSAGAAIVYHVTNNGLTLTGSTAGGPVFVIVLNPVTATYTVDMIGTVDVTTDVDFSSGGYDFAGGNTAWNGFIPINEALGGVFQDNNSADLLLTPERAGLPAGTINTTATAGGVGGAGGGNSGNNIGTGPETFRIDFVTDLSGNPAGITYADEANRDHVFDGHYPVNGSTAIFASTTGSIVNFAAFFDDDTTGGVGNDVVGDGAPRAVTGISVSFLNGSQFFDVSAAGQQSFANVTIGGRQFTITELGDGTVNISGVVTGTQVGVFTLNGYNSLEYSFVSGEQFQIGQFGASVPTVGSVSFDVPIELVDGDGDTVTDSIGVTLTPPDQVIQDFSLSGAGVTPVIGAANPHVIGSEFNDTLNGDLSLNTLFGNDGNDIISGGAGNDVLIGGAGNDTLTGGTGIDRMIFEEVGAANQDTINLYAGTGAARDILDLSGLLDANFGGGSVVSNFVRLQVTGADRNVQVDTDGLANGDNFTTVATLTNYNTIGSIVTTYFEGAEHQLTVT